MNGVSGDPYWNHNTHYHRWLLDRVPPGARTALDVGCGDGLLAGKLAGRCASVLGVDSDASILECVPADPRVRVEHSDFRDLTGTFDMVTAVASLHHVPLREGLSALHRLVAPGGTLAVVGLWRMSPGLDFGYLPLLPAIWAINAYRRPADPGAAVLDPADTLHQIRTAAAAVLPGARIRRRLLWRYTLLWRKPA